MPGTARIVGEVNAGKKTKKEVSLKDEYEEVWHNNGNIIPVIRRYVRRCMKVR